MSQAVLDYDGEVFNEAEYGVKVSNSSVDLEMMQNLKALSQAFLQNGGSLSVVADLYRTNDPSSFQRKLESFEEERMQREQAKVESDERMHGKNIEFEKYKHDSTIQKDILVAEIGADTSGDPLASDKLALEKEKLDRQAEEADKKLDLESKKLNETKRHNVAAEAISRKPKPASK